MITTDISYRGPPEIIIYMVKIRAGFAVIDGITQFGCNLSGSACYNSYGGDMGGGGGGGGSYFLKRGVRKKGGSWEPPEPPWLRACISDQQVFCNDLLRFTLNLACVLTFNILTKMQIFTYVSRARFEIWPWHIWEKGRFSLRCNILTIITMVLLGAESWLIDFFKALMLL